MLCLLLVCLLSTARLIEEVASDKIRMRRPTVSAKGDMRVRFGVVEAPAKAEVHYVDLKSRGGECDAKKIIDRCVWRDCNYSMPQI